MRSDQNIFLIGPMGAGKTTVGRLLAKELQFSFYDSDKEIEAKTGANVAWIFDIEGESGFRHREEQIIEKLTTLPNIVLATGGGAILSVKNRQLLSTRGKVVYLYVSVERQLVRIGQAKDRPLLFEKANMLETLNTLFEKREPIYRQLADLIIDTDNVSSQEVVEQILLTLEKG